MCSDGLGGWHVRSRGEMFSGWQYSWLLWRNLLLAPLLLHIAWLFLWQSLWQRSDRLHVLLAAAPGLLPRLSRR